jgi:pimeloyl-ACP methyl ester carboxylesterase
VILAAGRDEIIPAASTQQLLSRFANGIASMKVVDGADHNSISENPAYPSLLRN